MRGGGLLILIVIHQSDVVLWHSLVAHAPIGLQFSPGYTLSYAFSRSMNTQCKSRCPALYLSCSCLSTKIATVVDPNCSSRRPMLSSRCFSVDSRALSHIASWCDTLAWCPDSSTMCLLYSWRWVSRCLLPYGIFSSSVILSNASFRKHSLQFFPNYSTLLSV